MNELLSSERSRSEILEFWDCVCCHGSKHIRGRYVAEGRSRGCSQRMPIRWHRQPRTILRPVRAIICLSDPLPGYVWKMMHEPLKNSLWVMQNIVSKHVPTHPRGQLLSEMWEVRIGRVETASFLRAMLARTFHWRRRRSLVNNGWRYPTGYRSSWHVCRPGCSDRCRCTGGA